MRTLIAFLATVVTCIHLAYACSPSETKWVNHTARIVNVEPDTATVKHSIGGSVKITSGCTFAVRNMTIIPSGNGVYWWGIPTANNTDPYPRVVMQALGSYNGQSIVFTLDSQYSFDDIAIMEIYSEGDIRPYGAWSISGNISAYYGIGNDATLGFDPADWPSGADKSIPTSVLLLVPLLLAVAYLLI